MLGGEGDYTVYSLLLFVCLCYAKFTPYQPCTVCQGTTITSIL